MTEAASELVEEAYRAWNAGGPGALVEFTSERVELHDAPEVPDAQEWVGRDALLGRLEDVVASTGGSRAAIDEVRPVADEVLVSLRWGLDPASPETSASVYHVVRVEGGRIARIRVFLDEDAAIRAAVASWEASQANVELVRRAFEAFNRRDRDAFLALMADDVEAESRLAAFEGGYHGHEGTMRWWDSVLETFPDYAPQIEEARDLGDATVVRFLARGHSAGSSTPLIDPAWHAARWRDGRCVWWRICGTEAEALEAIERSRRAGG
jgi:ketosteroid isomerase-like protein